MVYDGKALIVRRAQPPARGLYTLPGGVVEIGETLFDALIREVREETALTIKPIALAGHREMITRDAAGRIERHFVILCFAARLVSGTATPNDEEIAEIIWCKPADLTGLHTTDGLGEIIAAGFTLLGDRP
jgi:ADP-ribose pyrophosphatase YjhB (NUDIX family)